MPKVELNRAILKNVGKRMASKYSSPLTAALYGNQQQQQEQRQMQQPYEYELIPTTLIFDYLQQQQQQQRHPWLPYEANAAIQFDNNYINEAIEGSSSGDEDDAENDVDNGELEFMALNRVFGGNKDKHSSMKHITKQQSSNEHSNKANEQQQQREHETATFQKSINNSNRNDERKRLTLINNHQQQQQQQHKNNLNLDLNDANPNANDFNKEMNDNGSSDDYQIQRYLYHLHKNQNHLTRK